MPGLTLEVLRVLAPLLGLNLDEADLQDRLALYGGPAGVLADLDDAGALRGVAPLVLPSFPVCPPYPPDPACPACPACGSDPAVEGR